MFGPIIPAEVAGRVPISKARAPAVTMIGDKINETEERAVLHVALRAARNSTITSEGKNVVPEVWSVLEARRSLCVA